MQLKIPKSATEAVVAADDAKKFEDLGAVELYRGALILLLKENSPPIWHIYIYAIEQKGDDIELSESKATHSGSDNITAMIYAKGVIDDAIAAGRMLEQNNEDVYIPDMEDMFLIPAKNHAKYIERKNSQSAAAAVSRTVDDLVNKMRSSGGKLSYTVPSSGTTVVGYVAEIYYDTSAGRYRVRTNDGINGLRNTTFPRDKRPADGVYIVKNLTFNGTNYLVPNATLMTRIR